MKIKDKLHDRAGVGVDFTLSPGGIGMLLLS